jgi:N-acetylmuramoyl-L-alanine amidase/FG-GAP-like repeat
VRRWAVVALTVITLSTFFVVVPAPQWAMAEEMAVRDVHVDLLRSTVDHSTQAVATAGLDASEVRHLQEARRDRTRRTTGVRTQSVRAVGVTVDAVPDGPVLVRARVGGTWTPWFEVPFLDGETPDLPAGTADPHWDLTSEPLWLGEADAYELDAPRSTASVDVHEVVVGRTTRTLAVGDVAGAAGAPTILSRASWGARPPSKTPSTTADLKIAIVHHTVSGNSYTPSQVPQILRSIQAYHQDARGFDDIAYNFVVDRFGRIWEGRAGGVTNVVVGGHSQGFNTGSVGVVALGDYRTAIVTSSMFESIARVIAWKFALHRVDPSSTVPFTSAGSAKYASGRTVTLKRVVGHGDVQATSCPGTNLIARLPALRTRVSQLVPSYQAGLGPLLLDPDVTGDGLTDPFEYRPGGGADVQWRATTGGTFVKSAKAVSGAYRPAVGDFDGNGRDDIFWHGTGSSADWIWWSTPTGRTQQALSVGGSYVPVVGDFDGNGADDLLWYATGLAPDFVWYFDANRQHRSKPVTQDLITGVPLVGDFDGDARDDVFFYGPGSSASDYLWWSEGQSWDVAGTSVNGRYHPAVHDADGNGRDEVTWLAPGATGSYRWSFSPERSVTSRALSHPAVTGYPSVGDFDGDGAEDLLVVAPGGAPDAAWYSTPSGIDVRSVSINGTYSVASGAMDAPLLLGPDPDDVLFVSNGHDWLWRGQADRTFRSTPVG